MTYQGGDRKGKEGAVVFWGSGRGVGEVLLGMGKGIERGQLRVEGLRVTDRSGH